MEVLWPLSKRFLWCMCFIVRKPFSTNFFLSIVTLDHDFLLETLDAFKHEGGQHLLLLIHLWLIGWLTFLMSHWVSLRIFHSVINCILWKPPEHASYLGVGVGLRESPVVLSECGAHYVPTQIFLPSKFSYILFWRGPTKLKLGLQISGRLLIANHLDQSLWLTNQKQGELVRSSYLLHSSLACIKQNCLAKTVLLSQTRMLCRVMNWALAELL